MRTRYDDDGNKAFGWRFHRYFFNLIYIALIDDKLPRPDIGLFADKNNNYM